MPVVVTDVHPVGYYTEGAWRRGSRDAWNALQSRAFVLLSVGTSALVLVVTFPFIDDERHAVEARAFMTGTTVILGVMVAYVLLVAFFIVATPKRQRDEARARCLRMEAHHREQLDKLRAYNGELVQENKRLKGQSE